MKEKAASVPGPPAALVSRARALMYGAAQVSINKAADQEVGQWEPISVLTHPPISRAQYPIPRAHPLELVDGYFHNSPT